jgi:hypothetical protein
MRERWFADNRDLVKWATLLHIARENGLAAILQVPYLRSETKLPSVRIDDRDVVIDAKVWRFFRDLARIEELGVTAGISIRVVTTPFVAGAREVYLQSVRSEIAAARHPLLLFLDPDTGLQPAQVGPAHTTTCEIQECWDALTGGDWLVLYQHARRTTTWIEDVRKQFAAACGEAPVMIAKSAEIGTDVAFLAARRS